ncbi:MAG: 4Fe-4S dicluster domain-containing protein [Chloroflexi bacterium]|nr:4Fe-4S dicluster domain-containing protein [Chloroflexota bacterium]
MTSKRENPDMKEHIGRLLRGAQVDAGLGQEAARDAQRVASGEISEAKFYEKYHGAYLKEFGIDLRPESSRSGKDELMSKSFFKDSISRRTLFKVAGASAAVLALNMWLGRRALAATRDDIPRVTPVQYGMVIDLEKCDGCLTCVAACKGHNSLDEAVYWLHIISYTDSNRPEVNLLPRFCNHCSNAPCIKVCPVGARFKRDDGLVLIDYDRCIGCRYCMTACPYGVNYFQWTDPAYPLNIEPVSRGRRVAGRPEEGIMSKCDFCPERQDAAGAKGTTICQLTCPHNVIHFGDLNDPQSEPNRYLEQKRKEKGYISTFGLREEFGTKPNVIYIGQQPSANARLAPLPKSYESMGWIAERKEVLGGPQPWFMKALGVKENGPVH